MLDDDSLRPNCSSYSSSYTCPGGNGGREARCRDNLAFWIFARNSTVASRRPTIRPRAGAMRKHAKARKRGAPELNVGAPGVLGARRGW